MKQKRSYILSLLALVLILCAFIQPAWAYFTSSKEADGAVPIYFTRKTTITEDVQGLTKIVTIQNIKPENEPGVYVWVRAQAHAGAQYNLNVSGTGWTERGDWWYYDTPVAPGGSAGALNVTLVIPEGVKPTDVVNVGVVYESTTAFYKENGIDFKPADWSAPLLDAGSSTPNP